MKIESNRREFLRSASLAGAALVAGSGALATTGCVSDEKHEQVKKELDQVKKQLEEEKAQSSTLPPQVKVEDDGRLTILDEAVAAKLGVVWEKQERQPGYKPDFPYPPAPKTPRRGIVVKFVYWVPDQSGRDPEEKKVNSLCNC